MLGMSGFTAWTIGSGVSWRSKRRARRSGRVPQRSPGSRAQRSTRQHDPGTGAAAIRSPARIGARSQGRSRSDTPADRSSRPAVSSHGRVLPRGAAGGRASGVRSAGRSAAGARGRCACEHHSRGSQSRRTDADLASLEALVRRHAVLDDVGLTLRTLDDRGLLSLGSRGGIPDRFTGGGSRGRRNACGPVSHAGIHLSRQHAASRRSEIPYSLVTAIDLERSTRRWPSRRVATSAHRAGTPGRPRICRPRRVTLTLTYDFWEESGQLVTLTGGIPGSECGAESMRATGIAYLTIRE